jgi:hypothetical protein
MGMIKSPRFFLEAVVQADNIFKDQVPVGVDYPSRPTAIFSLEKE